MVIASYLIWATLCDNKLATLRTLDNIVKRDSEIYKLEVIISIQQL